MALSRLRNPVISRAPSLLRARLFSSTCRSLPRQNSHHLLPL
ncbi:unnamed protein product [Coffea canephora]|uniref:DH200=94 genomic scaffold, scaffold_591 n=1 Tax=Coffea canephora TaxID=49390 RepID=A0A068VG19_COFCA|nr:unnamed protein product [Coffea canephora]